MRTTKFRLFARVGIFTLATLSVAGRSATILDDVPDSNYVALGNDPAFAAVGTFSANLTGCGTLIAPDWVLTAAHLILGAQSGTFTLGGTAYSATQIITDPSWDGNPSDGNDFALVHLSSSLTAIPPVFYSGATMLGQTDTFVGYGFTGTGLTGWKTIDGQKRGFQSVVDVNNPNFGNPALVFGARFYSPASGNALPLEGCVAPGDSGGGVFVNDGSQYYLAGVISFVASTNGNPNSSYGNISGFDPIAPALPWIDSVVPEPSTFALLATPAVALALRRIYRRA